MNTELFQMKEINTCIVKTSEIIGNWTQHKTSDINIWTKTMQHF